jgi:hypothetical protein
MIELGRRDKERTIELSDPELETADIVDKVLRIMVKSRKITEMTPTSHRPILRFIDKYDLQFERQNIRGEIALMLALPREEEIDDILIMFDLACGLQDWGLCGAIVERSLTFEMSEFTDEFGEAKEGGTPLDPMALSRASLKLHDSTTKMSDYWRKKAMADEFVRLMQLKGEFQDSRLRARQLTILGAPRDR